MNRSLFLLALPLAGCNLLGGTKFDGTWLFTFDPNAQLSGTCAEADTGGSYTYTYTGSENTLVDIYSGPSGDLIIGMNDEILVGTPEGNAFTASWDQSVSVDTGGGPSSETERYTLKGTLEGGVLKGELVRFDEESDADDTFNCTQTVTYTAQKVVSNDNKYVE